MNCFSNFKPSLTFHIVLMFFFIKTNTNLKKKDLDLFGQVAH